MASRTIVITGANSGIGYETAQHFAGKGERVVMACRNLDKARKAQAEILATVPKASTEILQLDVSELDSVAEFCRQFSDQIGSLDMLINNAGIVAVPLERTRAGHELQLATNYLGAFALTGTLLPLFNPDRPGRIVNVISLAHRLGKFNLEDFNWEITPYNEWKAYAVGKLAMMTFTLELNRRLRESGSQIIALGAHPGFANTNIYLNSPTLRESMGNWFNRRMQKLVPLPDSAAQPIIIAAESKEAKGGDYYGPGGILETGIFGKPGQARINPLARSHDIAKWLWQQSEAMTGVSYLSGTDSTPESPSQQQTEEA